jgi:hypothetical protein
MLPDHVYSPPERRSALTNRPVDHNETDVSTAPGFLRWKVSGARSQVRDEPGDPGNVAEQLDAHGEFEYASGVTNKVCHGARRSLGSWWLAQGMGRSLRLLRLLRLRRPGERARLVRVRCLLRDRSVFGRGRDVRLQRDTRRVRGHPTNRGGGTSCVSRRYWRSGPRA